MHQQSSKKKLSQLRFRAFLFFTNTWLFSASVILTTYGVFTSSKAYIEVGCAQLILTICLGLLYFIISSSWKCPLCSGAVWTKSKCSKNPKAKKALGLSYRLNIASRVIFKLPYRCPYCGEKFSSRQTRR